MFNPFRKRQEAFKDTALDEDPEPVDWSRTKRQPLDRQTFSMIKTDIREATDSNVSIAKMYGVSLTTFYLVKRSKSYADFKKLRRLHSKPRYYGG